MQQVGRTLVLAAALVLLSACSGGDGGAAADTPGRAQRDSLLGTLPVPGAAAVGAALRAADSARARALLHDSLGG